jgi:RND family efflux transporter MFP subunit
MKKLLRFFVPVLILGLLAAGVYWRIRGEGEADPAAAGEAGDSTSAIGTSAADQFATLPIAVEAAPVLHGEMVLVVAAEGQATAEKMTVVRARVAGRVTSTPVRESSSVGDGTVVLAIDTTEYSLNLRDAQANLAARQRQFEELTLGDDRIEDPAVREGRARAAREKSGVEQAEVMVEKARLEFAHTRVLAPFAGRVADLKVVEGQWVNAGDELMTVVDLNPIRVQVEVLESDVGHLARGGGADLVFAAFPGERFHGRIETINPVVDQRTRKARVTVSVPNPDARILPGFYAEARLDARRLADRVMVPREAVIERDRRTLVFIFEPSGEGETGTAMWQYVSTGIENGTYVEIIEDPDDTSTRMLRPGEMVLTDGHVTLVHGAAVRVVPAVTESAGGRPR